MTAPAVAPWRPERSLQGDVAWVLAGSVLLTLAARVLGLPFASAAPIWWASAGLAAVLATAPRARWGVLAAAALAAIAATKAAFGEPLDTALACAFAFTLEGLVGGWLAAAFLARTGGAGTPLAFALMLMLVAFVPPLAGASVDAALVELLRAGAPNTRDGFVAHWLASWSGDSFGAISLFPFALALRREPVVPVKPSRTIASVVLVSGVVVLTLVAFRTLPRPFAFTSLVLGASALVAGTRTLFLLVWACTVAAAWGISRRLAPAGEVTIAWQQLNVFLPVMAIAGPIQVLSVALQRLSQANEVLQRSRERFRRLYDRAPVMLQSLDEDGRTIEVNAQWLATLGYDSADAVRGMPLAHFLAPEERTGGTLPWHRRLLDGGGHKLHVRLRRRTGETIHALASAASTPDDPDTARGVVLAFEDVSVELAMRAEIERERDQLAALTSATSDLAIFLDRELRYRSVNRAFERYWGLSRAEVIGRHQSEVIGAELFTREFAAPLARALAGVASNFQVAVEFDNVGPRMMEVAMAPAYGAGGAQAGVVLTLHDVTELVEATRELRLLVEELQHANEGLEQFARIASHDLREPLNTISQFAGLIEQDFADELPPDAQRYFGLMGKAAARMKAMLDDVLQFARLERAPQIAMELVSLDRVFADLAMLLHARLTQTRAQLDVAPALPDVMGQTSLVELLFQNLLINAMRYTAPGTPPRIEVDAECMGDLVVVTVTDHGIGIPADELERVFLPFHRLQSWRPNEDSGLGLAICRRIATALGGRIWAESEDFKGSRLKVALKAAA